jgi:hypothetical protein
VTVAVRRSVEAAVLNRAAGALLASAVGEGLGGGGGEWVDLTATTLSHLGDPAALRDALADPSAVGARVLWALAIRHTVLTGELDARVGLTGLTGEVQTLWSRRLAEAEALPASSFSDGSAVHAIQAAWSVIMATEVLPYDMERHLGDALEACLPFGAPVPAIAGGLLGACHGVDAVPAEWVEQLPDATDVVHRARELAAASWVEDPDAELFDLPGGE